MARTETVEFSGYTMEAREQADGSWVGEVIDRAVPQMTATSLDNLEEQFRSVIGALAENEAQVDNETYDSSHNALHHHLHAHPLGSATRPGGHDHDHRPPEPGEEIPRERWED